MKRRASPLGILTLLPLVDLMAIGLTTLIVVALLDALLSRSHEDHLGRVSRNTATSARQPVYVEIRGSRAFALGTPDIRRDIRRFGSVSVAEMRQMVETLNERELASDWHRFEFSLEEYGLTAIPTYTVYPVDNASNAAPAGALDASSPFRDLLRRLAPQRHALHFLVRADGFETFREVRDFTLQRGYAIHWTPYENNEPIRISPLTGVVSPGPR